MVKFRVDKRSLLVDRNGLYFVKSAYLLNFKKHINISIIYTTYHLTSAEELNTDILDAIKATFKSKPITIIVEENEQNIELTDDMKALLNDRLQEEEEN